MAFQYSTNFLVAVNIFKRKCIQRRRGGVRAINHWRKIFLFSSSYALLYKQQLNFVNHQSHKQAGILSLWSPAANNRSFTRGHNQWLIILADKTAFTAHWLFSHFETHCSYIRIPYIFFFSRIISAAREWQPLSHTETQRENKNSRGKERRERDNNARLRAMM